MSFHREHNQETKCQTCYRRVDPSRLQEKHSKVYQFRYKEDLWLQLLKRLNHLVLHFHLCRETRLHSLDLYGRFSFDVELSMLLPSVSVWPIWGSHRKGNCFWCDAVFFNINHHRLQIPWPSTKIVNCPQRMLLCIR